MNNQPPDVIIQQLSKGLSFFFQFSTFLLKLDFKSFSIGVAYKFSEKVLTVISTILPLKILLFLSPNQELIGITADFFENKKQFVIFLCVLMLFFMALSYLFSKLSIKVSNKKLDNIIRTSKVDIGGHQVKNINEKIRLCISSCSSFLLLVLLLVPLFFVYPELFFIAIIVSTASFIFLRCIDIIKFLILQELTKAPQITFNLISKFLFLTSFSFIIFDALTNPGNRSFIEMMVGLILMRRVSKQIGQLCIAIVQLNKNKEFGLELMEAST